MWSFVSTFLDPGEAGAWWSFKKLSTIQKMMAWYELKIGSRWKIVMFIKPNNNNNNNNS